MKRYLIFQKVHAPVEADTPKWVEDHFDDMIEYEDSSEDEIEIWEIEGTIKKWELEVKHTWKEKKG